MDICICKVTKHTTVSMIFSLLLMLLQSPKDGGAASVNDPHYLGYDCPEDGYSYTAGSTFEENLNVTLFSHLTVNASQLAYSSLTMGEGIDQIYAMYYCRGDVGVKGCHQCVDSAASRIRNICKFMKQGIVWYRECTLRYANHTISSLTTQDLTLRKPIYNDTAVMGNYLNEYRSTFDKIMLDLINTTANNASLDPLGFATKQGKLSPYQTLRGMAQCAPIITGSSCQRCLNAAFRLMDLWANTMVFLPACLIGFELYGFHPSPVPPPPSSILPARYKILLPLLAVAVILSLIGGFWLWKRRSSKGDQQPPPLKEQNDRTTPESHQHDPHNDNGEQGEHVLRQHGLLQFAYSEVEGMTDGFKKQIGEGGYAVVYHGYIKDSSREVAVKVFSKNDAPMQFSTEVEVLGRISHKNLVSLVGVCEEGTNLALVYEFMEMGDLKTLLTGNSDALGWIKRVEIALDTAQGLDYLHNGCSPPIVHRDVKPANILLNKEYRAKVADFGFSKIFPAEYVSHLQSRVIGTLGYLDPQYNLTGIVNEKGDTYSFGVVLLELITGKTAIVNKVMNLGQWVRNVLEKGDIASILDPILRETIDDNYLSVWKTVELAMRCIQLDAAERPTMTQIVSELKDCLSIMSAGSSGSAKDSHEITSAAFSSSTMSPRPR